MGVMGNNTWPKALVPGVNKWFGIGYNDYTVEYTEIFEYNKSSRAYEEDVGSTGLGLLEVKDQGDGISYDAMKQGYICRYTHVVYAKGIIFTWEEFTDNLYPQLVKSRGRELGHSARITKDTVGANHLNRAFNDSYTGGDGKELCATDHPNQAGVGGTYQNELTNAADLSEASLEQMLIDIGNMTNDRGLPIAIKPKKLIIHGNQQFEAQRILQSTLQNDTAQNAINAIKSMGAIPGGFTINHYLTDTDAFFLTTDCPDGLKYFEHTADIFDSDNDMDTKNAKFAVFGRYVFGWTNPRGVYGSPGK